MVPVLRLQARIFAVFCPDLGQTHRLDPSMSPICCYLCFKTTRLRLPQVLEDTTGVRRVVVTPQSPECYPPSYSPALSPTHHLPPYLAHPHFIPNSHSFYPPVSPGELPPHQYYQHHLHPMYSDQGTASAACGPQV